MSIPLDRRQEVINEGMNGLQQGIVYIKVAARLIFNGRLVTKYGHKLMRRK